MPELPEVERFRQLAEWAVLERQVAGVRAEPDALVFPEGGPDAFVQALTGRRVRRVERLGKYVWFELDRAPHPVFHFGLSGAFRVPGVAPVELESVPELDPEEWPPRWWKALLGMADPPSGRDPAGGGTEARTIPAFPGPRPPELAYTDMRRLGRIVLRDRPLEEPPLSELGWDALRGLPPARVLADALARRRGPIKSVLLDQQLFAGVGNWMADEALYQAGIAPTRPASGLSLEEVKRLRTALRRIARTGVAALSRGATYPRTWLFHRRWESGRARGAPGCVRTARGEPVEFLRIGGRTTAWVPARQR